MTPRTSCGHTEIRNKLREEYISFKRGGGISPENENYQGQSFSKIIEKKNVFRSFVSHVERNNIYFNKFGFRNNDSTNGEILQNWSCSNKVMFDHFKRVFDTVSHVLLINRLQVYDTGGILLSWFRNYLCDLYLFTQNKHSKENSFMFVYAGNGK